MVTTGDPPLRTPPIFWDGCFHPGPLRPRHSSARLLPAERAKEKHLNSGGKIPGLGGPCPSCSLGHGTSMARGPWETWWEMGGLSTNLVPHISTNDDVTQSHIHELKFCRPNTDTDRADRKRHCKALLILAGAYLEIGQRLVTISLRPVKFLYPGWFTSAGEPLLQKQRKKVNKNMRYHAITMDRRN